MPISATSPVSDGTAVPRITRHFVTVNGRRVHYRRAGSGPALAMLHASPRSSTELRVNQEVFASRLTTLAFDTPGFGLSDRLPPAQPETEDLADALAETLAALGIEQALVYGRHTGASVAVEFAARHPERCAMALTNGFPIYSKAQAQDRLTRYLTPLVPSFEGAHLLWLWFRFREQHVFWPWHEHDLAHRARTDAPDLAVMHRGVMEFLESGDEYRVGYATAFRHRGLAALADLRVPVCFGNRRSDSVWRTHTLYPPEAWTQEFPAETHEAACAELLVLRAHTAPPPPPPPPPGAAEIAGRNTLDFLDLDATQILLRTRGDLRAGVPVVAIHHAPGSSALYDELVAALGAHQPVLAFDLPGHGESDAGPGTVQSVPGWTTALFQVLDRLGLGAVHLYGHGSGAAVATEAALRQPGRIRTLLLDAPLAFPARQRKELGQGWITDVLPATPCWDGGHLLRVWHMLRDSELWFPWHDRRDASARTVPPRIDPASLTLRLRETMKQPDSFAPAWQAAWSYPLIERLSLLTRPCHLLGAEQDPFFPALPHARAVLPEADLTVVADTAEARAAAILAALRDAD